MFLILAAVSLQYIDTEQVSRDFTAEESSSDYVIVFLKGLNRLN